MEIAIWIIAITEVIAVSISIFNVIRNEKSIKTMEEMKSKYAEFVESQAKHTTQHYHFNCTHCGKDLWTEDAFPIVCPFCFERLIQLQHTSQYKRMNMT